MSLSAREIELLVQELQPLQGAFVQKIRVSEPRTVLLELRKPGVSHTLLISAETGRSRLHLCRNRLVSPEAPFAFQGLLRAQLGGACLTALAGTPNDRVVTLRFRAKTAQRVLVAELLGRHGNLFLLNEQGVIRYSAVPNLSERRDNKPGNPYVHLLPRTLMPENGCSRFMPREGAFGLSWAVELAYQEIARTSAVEERRRVLFQRLRSQKKRLERTLGKVEADLARANQAEENLRIGELIKSNLGRIKRGSTEVQVLEYSEQGPKQVRVSLDPAKTPQENLEYRFRQYRRLLSGQAHARQRLAILQDELEDIVRQIDQLAATDDEKLLTQPVVFPKKPSGRGGKLAVSKDFRQFVSQSGRRIRVGKGAQGNDRLTFRYSRGNDIWLHARGVPGAHVVLSVEKEAPSPEELLDAAQLAAHFSSARGESAEIAWTRVKYVRKQKGSPGAVLYSQDKTLRIRPEPERLTRLLEAEIE